MSKLKEITGYNRGNKQVMKFTNLVQLPSLPLQDLFELALKDENDNPYIFRLFKPESTSDTLEDVACESISIDLSDIKEIFIKLTDEQRNIVMHIYYLYKNRSNQDDEEYEETPKIILLGPAGSGKSTIISFIEKLITWEENKTSDCPQYLKVIKCAFTGKAAANIEGLTLNHIFSIPIYKTRSLSKKRLDTKKEVLQHCVLFICDEISMVGEKTMTNVNSRLQQIFDNETLYGGRIVLLVGDLYQIDPVRQKPLYPKSKFWTCCEFYELTKIMRQADEKFITALNNFRDSKMTQRDMKLLRSREVQNYDQVPNSAIHLFYENKRVDEYNNYKLNQSNEKEEVITAIEDDDKWDPSELRVKIGIRYMITCNVDVGDGLANGTTGIVKGFDYDKNGFVSAVWMEFHSDKIGKKTRLEYLNKHKKSGCENWVPIARSKIVMKLKANPKVTKTGGNMFPLKAAEAITVHKSQGQTYHEGVCVHFTKDPYDKLRNDKSLQYVALTRVTRLEDLYIMGDLDFSVVNSEKFERIEKEINRLRNENKLKLAFETFEDTSGDVIVYLNTGSTFHEHHEFITADRWYSNASLLIFTETNTSISDQIEIPNFEIAFRSDVETRTCESTICYKEKGKSVKVVSSTKDDENKMYLTLLLFENYLYILAGVKGKMCDKIFTNIIKKIISRYVRGENCIFFIGDFNKNVTPTLIDDFNDLNFKRKISCDIATSEETQQCDVVFTRNLNIQRDQIGHYQYIPSSHKPIYVKLPPRPELLKSHCKSQVSDGIDSDSQSVYSEAQSAYSGSQYADNESQYADSESQYADSESQSVYRGSQSVYSEAQSAYSGSQYADNESQYADSESQYADSESQSVYRGSQSEYSESQSEYSGPQSVYRGSQSEYSGSQSEHSGSQSEYSESQSVYIGSQSVYSGSQSANSESQSENGESQPMDSEPDDSQTLSESMEMDDERFPFSFNLK
ncbi:hypothetical protein ABMA27_015861 [Loxostege sticticalis]|uniref:ATP-dependent DNA helicase n=1 Tax=Loxostege sticticalis TaxID=481309 RepID=A0ABR3I4L9_LOXSC